MKRVFVHKNQSANLAYFNKNQVPERIRSSLEEYNLISDQELQEFWAAAKLGLEPNCTRCGAWNNEQFTSLEEYQKAKEDAKKN